MFQPCICNVYREHYRAASGYAIMCGVMGWSRQFFFCLVCRLAKWWSWIFFIDTFKISMKTYCCDDHLPCAYMCALTCTRIETSPNVCTGKPCINVYRDEHCRAASGYAITFSWIGLLALSSTLVPSIPVYLVLLIPLMLCNGRLPGVPPCACISVLFDLHL